MNTVTPQTKRISNTKHLEVQENDQGDMTSRGVCNRNSDSHEFLLRACVLHTQKYATRWEWLCINLFGLTIHYFDGCVGKNSQVTLNDYLFFGMTMDDVNASFFCKSY